MIEKIQDTTTNEYVIGGNLIESVTPRLLSKNAIQIAGLIPCNLNDSMLDTIKDGCVHAYATPSGSDDRENDHLYFLHQIPILTDLDQYELYKYDSSGSLVLQQILNESSTVADLSIFPFYYRLGIKISVQDVLNTFGEGCYRIKVADSLWSFTICLEYYSADLVDRTSRLDTVYQNGYIGDLNSQNGRFDMKDMQWHDQCRYIASFTHTDGSHEKETYAYRNGVQETNKITMKKRFKGTMLGHRNLMERLYYYGVSSLYGVINEYNKESDICVENESVLIGSDFAPDYIGYTAEAYRLDLEFERRKDNLGWKASL